MRERVWLDCSFESLRTRTGFFSEIAKLLRSVEVVSRKSLRRGLGGYRRPVVIAVLALVETFSSKTVDGGFED